MSDEASVSKLHDEISKKVIEYYRLVHARKTPFVAGQTRIPYGGRVFDENELVIAVEAALEFWLTAGRFSMTFEEKLARYVGTAHCALTNSGSSANLLAFGALTAAELKDRRIEKGDEVITVAAGFPTTVAPLIQHGAVPVFIDITVENGTYNIDASALEEAVSPRTRAVMLAHTLGNPFDLDAVAALCAKHHLWLVEDNCDALGATYRGRPTGSFGDLSTFSFYPPHHITMGEGGAVCTADPVLNKLVLSFRDWGRDCHCLPGYDNSCGRRFATQLGTLPPGYDHKHVFSHFGYNLKPTDLQAAIGVAQMEKLDGFVEARRRNWETLRDGLSDLEDRFVLPRPTPHAEPSWFGFVLTPRPGSQLKRKDLVRQLEANQIQTRGLFAGNLVRHPCFDEMRASGTGYRVIGELSGTERATNDTFWLGVYPGLEPAMLDYVIEQVRALAA